MTREDIVAGDVFATNEGGSVTVLEYRSARNVLVEHNDHHRHKATVRSYNLRSGKVKNPYRKAVCGVGFAGVGDHKKRIGNQDSPAYRSWARVLQRAYTEGFHKRRPTYVGVTVCAEWMDFQNFADWWTQEPNSSTKGFHLDKDLRVAGSKEYSPRTCSFVPCQINTLLGSGGSQRRHLPQGVTPHGKRFNARVRLNGNTKSLGIYSTPDEAHQVYRKIKEQNVRLMAEYWRKHLHHEVYDYLSNWTLAGQSN